MDKIPDDDGAQIRAISLTQPWASLVAIGAKKYETRSWGPARARVGKLLAIHATKSMPPHAQQAVETLLFKETLAHGGIDEPQALPHGSIIAVCALVSVWQIEPNDGDPLQLIGEMIMREVHGTHIRALPFGREYVFGDYSRGRYVWELGGIVRLREPIPVRGMQGIWPLPADARLMLLREMAQGSVAFDEHKAEEVYSSPIKGTPLRLKDIY